MSIYNGRVLIKDEGYISISSAENLNVWNGETFTRDVVRTTEQVIKIELKGSNSLICSPDTKFYSKIKKRWIKASDLKTSYVLVGSSALPSFDYLELNEYTHLQKLNSYNAGLLVGFTKFFGQDRYYQLQYTKIELRMILEYCLKNVGVSFTTIENSSRAKPSLTYNVNTIDLRNECMSMVSDEGFSRDAWKSKFFLRGFFRMMVESATIRNDKLVLKFSRKLAKDVQQALLIFGVNSYTTKGLNIDSVTVNKECFPMVAKNIGAIDLSKTVKLYNNNFFTQATSKKPLTFKIIDVTMTNKHVEMFDVQDKLVSNGLIMCS